MFDTGHAAHVDYPHDAGTLYDCLACTEHERNEVAKRAGCDPEDVQGSLGEFTIDGMDADEWIDAMYDQG